MHYIFYIFDPLEDRIADAKKKLKISICLKNFIIVIYNLWYMLRPYIYYNISYLNLVSVLENCQKFSLRVLQKPALVSAYSHFIQFCCCEETVRKVLSAASGGGGVFSYKLRYVVGFGLVEMAISTNSKPTIYIYIVR